jgi:membrane-bound lytic murein transglycosylase A
VIRALLLCGLLALAACQAPVKPPPAAPEKPAPDRLTLTPASFAALPGWNEDRIAEALPALQRSCARLLRADPATALGIAGRAADWKPFCTAIDGPQTEAALRRVAERELVPVLAGNNGAAEGLFTGYFEASLNGSRTRTGRFTVPLLGPPADLVSVDLGEFRDSLKGQRIAGRVENGRLRPYEDRAAIERGALGGKAPVVLWTDSAVDAFFLHIQGSGRVTLPDGQVVRLNFAAQNGHPYTAIGRTLIDRGALTAETVSMQTIRDWLAANPAEAPGVMARNASYVFFRETAAKPDEGPQGAEGVPLTAGRSLAVDRAFLPMGLPLWLEATRPSADGATDLSFRRLMVAQDTGGAIRGPVRGDVYWGHGPDAAAIAGRMKHKGRYWLLLPKGVAQQAGS